MQVSATMDVKTIGTSLVMTPRHAISATVEVTTIGTNYIKNVCNASAPACVEYEQDQKEADLKDKRVSSKDEAVLERFHIGHAVLL